MMDGERVIVMNGREGLFGIGADSGVYYFESELE